VPEVVKRSPAKPEIQKHTSNTIKQLRIQTSADSTESSVQCF